jgi:hypothetical protein
MHDEVWRNTDGVLTGWPHHRDAMYSDREWNGEQHKRLETSVWWCPWRRCGFEDGLRAREAEMTDKRAPVFVGKMIGIHRHLTFQMIAISQKNAFEGIENHPTIRSERYDMVRENAGNHEKDFQHIEVQGK